MAILDSLMVLSENQYVNHTTAGTIKEVVCQHYIDLGENSKDYWGDGKTTRPGWWNPDVLTLVCKFGSTIPTTADGAPSYLSAVLYGTSSTSEVTHTPTFGGAYRYLIGGHARKDWPKTYPHSIIFQATIPRIFHRYVFVTYLINDVYYAYIDTWAGFGTQALSSIKNPEYPGSIA